MLEGDKVLFIEASSRRRFLIRWTFSYRYKRTHEYNIRDELEQKGFQLRQPEEITLEKEYEKLEKVCGVTCVKTVNRDW